MAALEFWVPGVARTKGSVDVGRHGQVLHTEASKVRAEAIRRAAVAAVRAVGWLTGTATAVAVEHFVWLPASGDAVSAIGPGSGDLDKMERLLWDALTAAEVWADDVQVVSVLARKHLARDPSTVGEYVLVRTTTPMAVQSLRLRDETTSRAAREAVIGRTPTPAGF